MADESNVQASSTADDSRSPLWMDSLSSHLLMRRRKRSMKVDLAEFAVSAETAAEERLALGHPLECTACSFRR